MQNSNIKKITKTKIIIFTVLIIIQITIFICIPKNFINAFDYDVNVSNIFKLLILLYIFALTIFNIVFLINIIKTKLLENVTPIKCQVEDFVYIGETNDGKRNYYICPLIKNTTNGELYFTYQRYNLSAYNTIYSQMNNTLINKQIIRKNKTIVNIGDYCNVYINKEIKPKIRIIEKDNIVYLNKKKMHFLHENKNYNISVFKNLKYFEGIIDFEI